MHSGVKFDLNELKENSCVLRFQDFFILINKIRCSVADKGSPFSYNIYIDLHKQEIYIQ